MEKQGLEWEVRGLCGHVALNRVHIATTPFAAQVNQENTEMCIISYYVESTHKTAK